MIQRYTVIDTVNLVCRSVILWDGVNLWTSPTNCITQIYNGTIDVNTAVARGTAVYTPVAPPLAPTNVIATPGAAQITLSWNASTGATSYTIIFIFPNVTSMPVGLMPYISTTNTSYAVTGLTNGKAYSFVVNAVGTNGAGSNSSEVSATPNG